MPPVASKRRCVASSKPPCKSPQGAARPENLGDISIWRMLKSTDAPERGRFRTFSPSPSGARTLRLHPGDDNDEAGGRRLGAGAEQRRRASAPKRSGTDPTQARPPRTTASNNGDWRMGQANSSSSTPISPTRWPRCPPEPPRAPGFSPASSRPAGSWPTGTRNHTNQAITAHPGLRDALAYSPPSAAKERSEWLTSRSTMRRELLSANLHEVFSEQDPTG
jgi:hypothetical protein